jgi:hypothetical protein
MNLHFQKRIDPGAATGPSPPPIYWLAVGLLGALMIGTGAGLMRGGWVSPMS